METIYLIWKVIHQSLTSQCALIVWYKRIQNYISHDGGIHFDTMIDFKTGLTAQRWSAQPLLINEYV